MERLDEEGWVTLPDDNHPRRELQGESDGALEFNQKPSSQDYWYRHGQRPGITSVEESLKAGQPEYKLTFSNGRYVTEDDL